MSYYPDIVVKLRNQVKTAAEPAETLRYTRHASAAEAKTAAYGTPFLLLQVVSFPQESTCEKKAAGGVQVTSDEKLEELGR